MAVSFKLDSFANGELADADEVMNNTNFALVTSINFALDGATITNQNNFKLDLFGSDTAQYLEFMEYNSGTDLYECIDTSSAYYMILEATSTTLTASGNVKILQMASGKWLIYNNAGTYEVNRAEIFKYLFYDYDNGADSNIITKVVGITALKTPDANDVGRRVHHAFVSVDINPGDVQQSHAATKTGTFANTTTNTGISSWSRCQTNTGDTGDAALAKWELASGTTLHSASDADGSGPTDSDEFGTDLSADEKDNQATCQLDCATTDGTGTGQNAIVTTLIFCKGDISWANAGTYGEQGGESDYDFYTDGSIPDTTATTESDLTCRITTDSTTITTDETIALVKSLNSLTAGNSIAYEISFNDGSNWQAVTEKLLAKITNLGTTFRVRMTITRATNDETDSITSYGAYYG